MPEKMSGQSTAPGFACRLAAILATALLLAAALLPAVASGGAIAQSLPAARAVTGESGLPLPRFVSLATDKANLRTGPGARYPILWVYVRRDQPLEVTAEYGVWRRVRDIDGTIGWMHGRLLSGRRSAIVTGDVRVLRAKPDTGARPLLRLAPGVLVEVDRCEDAWCRLEVRGKKGWLQRESLWGPYAGEEFE